ncbi:MAG: ADP-ribosylation factor-like protein [Myxococcota bacterium]|nr:ADP-ribosylation factor-like protein [Myxococcota bacterium]
MVQFNLEHRELTLKVVYYGPALSGKTTNLKALHAMAPSEATGRLMTLETQDDRTLFFDLLPLKVETQSGFRLKIKLFTVPGQVIHQSTRRLVLQGADAVAFVADSQIQQSTANKHAFADLQVNLAANQLAADLPMVVQFNKQDLESVRSLTEIRAFGHRVNRAVIPAVAVDGEGVIETLHTLLDHCWAQLDTQYDIGERLELSKNEFLNQFFTDWRPHYAGIGRHA